MMNGTGCLSNSQIAEWWHGIPMGTRIIFIVNVGLYVVGLCLPQDWSLSSHSAPSKFCMHPRSIWDDPSQAYRIFSSAFLHANLMHIGFNMFSFIQCGPSLERMVGTFKYLSIIFCFVTALGILYFGISISLLLTFHYGRFFDECAIGFSGVLFALMTIESLLSPPDRLLALPFGIQVPSRWYPWALLIFCQLIMPGVSFIGHMVGILGAYLYMLGAFRFVLPTETMLEKIEDLRIISALVSSSSFVKTTSAVLRLMPEQNQPGGSHYAWFIRIPTYIIMGVCGIVWSVIGPIFRPCLHFCMNRNRNVATGEAEDNLEEGHVQQPRFFGFGTWGGQSQGYAPVPQNVADGQAGTAGVGGSASGLREPFLGPSQAHSQTMPPASGAAHNAGEWSQRNRPPAVSVTNPAGGLMVGLGGGPSPVAVRPVPVSGMQQQSTWPGLTEAAAHAQLHQPVAGGDRIGPMGHYHVPYMPQWGGMPQQNANIGGLPQALQGQVQVVGFDEAVGRLADMGFDRPEAAEILAQCQGDINAAAEVLSQRREARLGPLHTFVR